MFSDENLYLLFFSYIFNLNKKTKITILIICPNVFFSNFVNMEKIKKPKRYFNDNTDEKVDKLKLDKKLNFDGDIIKVEMKPSKFKKNKLKQNFVKPNLDHNVVKKYSRGKKMSKKGVKTNFFKEKIIRKEIVLEYATEQAARSEVLRNEKEG